MSALRCICGDRPHVEHMDFTVYVSCGNCERVGGVADASMRDCRTGDDREREGIARWNEDVVNRLPRDVADPREDALAEQRAAARGAWL